jgi:polar amino acid transport system substrate-binding protein
MPVLVMTLRGAIRSVATGVALSLLPTFCLPALAGETLDRVTKSGVLREVLVNDYPPFSFINENSEIAGFDIDLSQAFAAKLGVKLVTDSPDWSVIVAGHWKGRWDICICSMTPTAPRAQVFDFITAYSQDPTVVVVNKDNDSIKSAADITGRKIGVGLGSSEQDYLERHFVSAEPGAKPVVYPFGDLTVVPYQGEDIAFLDLALGTGKRLDGVFTAYSTAKGRVEKDSRFKIVTGAHFFRTSSWVSVEKGVDPEWNAKVAQVIEDLKKDGTIRRISLKWLGYDSTPADEATTTTSSQ